MENLTAAVNSGLSSGSEGSPKIVINLKSMSEAYKLPLPVNTNWIEFMKHLHGFKGVKAFEKVAKRWLRLGKNCVIGLTLSFYETFVGHLNVY